MPTREADLLSAYPVFARLTGDERAALARHLVERRTLSPGEAVCTFEERPPGLVAVESGEVEVQRFVAVRAKPQNLGPGEVFGFSSLLAAQTHRVRAVAMRTSTVLVLPRERFDLAVAEAPGLRAFAREVVALHELAPRALEAMRTSSVLRKLGPRWHHALVERAHVIDVPADAVVVERRGEPRAMYLVLDGKLKASLDVDGDGTIDIVHSLRPGDCFGEAEVLSGRPYGLTVAARAPSRLLMIERAGVQHLAERSPGFSRALRSLSLEGRSVAEAVGMDGPEAIALLPDRGVDGAPLASLLAEAIAAQFGERAAVVRLFRGAAPDDGNLALEVPFTRADLAVVAAAVPGGPPDYLLLDGTALAGEEGAPLGESLHKAVLITRDPWTRRLPPDVPQGRVLPAALIDEVRTGERDAFPARTLRLPLDRARLGRTLDRLGEAERATFARFARAVTDRRVGLALGGGGAFGYAHLALLRGLVEAAVPIDLVSGSSIGAIVGAYWVARGEDGLRLLVDRRRWIARATMIGFVQSAAIEWLVDHDLPGVRLEELELPFFAVATDVYTGAERAFSWGRPGRAVRASGSFPGALTPTTIGALRFVDGGIISNVPDDVLVAEGAQVLIASNVVPPPSPLPPRAPLLGRGPIARWLHELNPLLRAQDVVRSVFILLHASGSADAQSADAVYNAAPNEWQVWSFPEAKKIVAEATPAVRATVEQARRRWEQVARPRRQRAGAAPPAAGDAP